jgi:hypothetical protein
MSKFVRNVALYWCCFQMVGPKPEGSSEVVSYELDSKIRP